MNNGFQEISMKKHTHNKSRLILKRDTVRLLNAANLTPPAALMDSESFFFSGCPCCPST
jgi:hypothetical protein